MNAYDIVEAVVKTGDAHDILTVVEQELTKRNLDQGVGNNLAVKFRKEVMIGDAYKFRLVSDIGRIALGYAAKLVVYDEVTKAIANEQDPTVRFTLMVWLEKMLFVGDDA